jgi:hypothetical protein
MHHVILKRQLPVELIMQKNDVKAAYTAYVQHKDQTLEERKAEEDEDARQLQTRVVQKEKEDEMSVVQRQEEARKWAREEREVDAWRTEQMDSWHEQEERERQRVEARANEQAENMKLKDESKAQQLQHRREMIKEEKKEIHDWRREQAHAWQAEKASEVTQVPSNIYRSIYQSIRGKLSID